MKLFPNFTSELFHYLLISWLNIRITIALFWLVCWLIGLWTKRKCSYFLINEWNIWVLVILISWMKSTLTVVGFWLFYCIEKIRARMVNRCKSNFAFSLVKLLINVDFSRSNLSPMILRHESTWCTFSLSEKGLIPQLTARIRDITPKTKKPCSTLSFQ